MLYLLFSSQISKAEPAKLVSFLMILGVAQAIDVDGGPSLETRDGVRLLT